MLVLAYNIAKVFIWKVFKAPLDMELSSLEVSLANFMCGCEWVGGVLDGKQNVVSNLICKIIIFVENIL